jgi:hypothetical protein
MLKEGAAFPPRSEIDRLNAYKVNSMLLDDEAWNALPAYKHRVNSILMNFSIPANYLYYYSANQWGDLVEKLQSLTYGEPPEISIADMNENTKLITTEILTKTKFIDVADEGSQDFYALGDWVTKIVPTNSGMSYINISPSIWFPVVAEDNVKEVKAHVLAWIADVDDKTKELRVQIHEKGYFTNRAFAVKKYADNATMSLPDTNQVVEHWTCEIGKELKTETRSAELNKEFPLKKLNNGLGNEFAIVHSANNPKTRTIYGTSDFEVITAPAMEYNVRMTLKDVVLDKHSAPKLYGPPIEKKDDGDDANPVIGNYVEVSYDSVTPNYLTWDANMHAVENTIDQTKEDISNFSGLGALLNSQTFGESQGYDALMIKLAPALMKSGRKKRILETHLKKVFSLISPSYGGKIEEEDITITWHDGIPTTESVRADIAQKHLTTGWSVKRVLMQDYGLTEEEAEMEIEQKRSETPQMPVFGVFDDPTDKENADKGGDNA